MSAGGTASKKSPGTSRMRAATAGGCSARKAVAALATHGLQSKGVDGQMILRHLIEALQLSSQLSCDLQHASPQPNTHLSTSTPRMPGWRSSSAARKLPVPPPTSHRVARPWRLQL